MEDNIEWLEPNKESDDMKNFREHLDFFNHLLEFYLCDTTMIKKSDDKEGK